MEDMKAGRERLFTPGTGAAPPALTGREREQEVLSQCLADLRGGRAPPHDVALMGPRGNGKTVLLNWFERACRDAGRIAVTRLSPARTRTGQALADVLLPASVIRKLLPRKVGVAGVGQAEWVAPALPVHDLTAPQRRRRHPPQPGRHVAPALPVHDLTARLITRCRARPLAVLVDEAHTLDRDVGQLLLNVSQEVRANAPFLLALAGTPGLPAHLGAMDASFWSRLGKGRLGIGLLSRAAACAALTDPLAGYGVSIDAAALDAVVDGSQRYPYFVQLWGEALWDRHLGEARLTAAHADAARPEVAARITDYYQDRYREIEARGLLPVAAAAARLFRSAATASDSDLDAALAATGADDAGRLAAREELHALGYVWCPPGQLPPVVWVPGIPPLMAYVLDRAPT